MIWATVSSGIVLTDRVEYQHLSWVSVNLNGQECVNLIQVITTYTTVGKNPLEEMEETCCAWKWKEVSRLEQEQ